MRMPTFTSVLAPALRSLAETRQALGYQDRGVLTYLAHFDRYLTARGWTLPYPTRAVVEDWVASTAGLQPVSRSQRLQVMRLLGRFLAPTHPESYVPGPAWNGPHYTGRHPYIYTPAQIRSLLAEARRLTPTGSLRPHTYATLLGLLYCTGLRISEALALRLAEVDLDANTLWVRDSKFRKSRLVPLGPRVSQAVRCYQQERARHGGPQDPEASLFLNERRRGCTYQGVCTTFLTLARRIGLRGPAGIRGPRLHDLRHSCAVQRLLEWYRDGGDVQARLPWLADYLGHVSFISTQVYLDVTAELLHEAARRFQPPGDPQPGPGGGAV
ncbi:MAG: tyrosine-type recombinase/integrase [Candidatus Latescibacteria bacterium]|nr:tyrosine-type recombinase/integrase [Candidatus Latescibacterota bacterium]